MFMGNSWTRHAFAVHAPCRVSLLQVTQTYTVELSNLCIVDNMIVTVKQ